MHDKILVIRLSALGDIAMVWPALVATAMQHPEREYYFLTSPMWVDVPRPKNMHVVPYYRHRYSGVRGFFRLMRILGKRRPTEVIDLHNVLRSWIIDCFFRLRGVPVRMVSKERNERKKILKEGAQAVPFTQRYAAMLGGNESATVLCDASHRTAAAPLTPAATEPTPPAANSATAAPQGLTGEQAIGIAPFARYATKTYPLPQMRQVVRMLAEKGAAIYLFGSRGEQAEILQRWVNELGIAHLAKVVPLMNLTLADELALISRLKAMVSMDSANGHLAAMMRTPVLSIWGSTTPACGFTPWPNPASRSICLGLPCQPCSIAGSKKCPLGHMNCLKQIKPEQIVDYITNLPKGEGL